MTCTPIRDRTGHVVAIACGTRKNEPKCCHCRQPATLLCDMPVEARVVNGWRFPNSTCDLPLCERCAVRHDGKDFCRGHAPKPKRDDAGEVMIPGVTHDIDGNRW